MHMNKILVIYAHPEAPSSRANRTLRDGARALLSSQSSKAKLGIDVKDDTETVEDVVTWHDLYQGYADFHIDVKAEQTLLLSHDVIVFQHPFYWYSVPALLKQWIDDVLADGWAYGGGANQLAGKGWGHWLTAGGSAGAYTEGGQNNFSVADLLRPLEQTALLCQCRWLAPQVTFSSLTLDEADLHAEASRYADWLDGLARAPHPESRDA
jgi:glutathione-regulated potassium-efflux system ancillary protein KefG